MLKVYDINNIQLIENIDYTVSGYILTSITGNIHRVEYSNEIKPNREQRRKVKKYECTSDTSRKDNSDIVRLKEILNKSE